MEDKELTDKDLKELTDKDLKKLIDKYPFHWYFKKKVEALEEDIENLAPCERETPRSSEVG